LCDDWFGFRHDGIDTVYSMLPDSKIGCMHRHMCVTVLAKL
jgi:hypothetical protein